MEEGQCDRPSVHQQATLLKSNSGQNVSHRKGSGLLSGVFELLSRKHFWEILKCMERSFLDREGLDPLPSVSLLSVSPLGRFTPLFLLVTRAFFFAGL